MNNKIWKNLGWLITRKLVYYTVIVFASVFVFSKSGELLTLKDSASNLVGGVIAAVGVGLLLTASIREVFYYNAKFNSSTPTNKENENE